jgi:hypothetical protein
LIRLVVIAEVIRDQSVQVSNAGYSLRESPASQHLAVPVLQLDVVMGLSPVVPEKQHLSKPTFHSMTHDAS